MDNINAGNMENSLIISTILDNLDACIYATDIETDEILFINERMKAEFGISEDVTGQVCWKLLQDGFTGRCEFCPKYKLSENPSEKVVWEEHNTVTKKYYKNTDKIIDWLGGRKAHVQYSADITDIKRAEQRIQQAETTLRTVIDNIPIPIFWKDKNLVIRGGNRTFADIVGISVDDIDGLVEEDYLDEETARYNTEIDKHVLSTGEMYEKEERVLMKEHGERWFEVLKTIIDNDDGLDMPFSLIAVTKDITDNKKLGRDLLRMSSIVENSSQYIAYIDDKGMFSYFNSATYDVTGYTHEELMEGGIALLYDAKTTERIHTEILPKIFELGKYDFELPLIRKDGQVRIMAFSGFMLGDDDGSCATIASDITERKMLEEQLILEKEIAEDASRAKTDFLSRMSHEIRTPMNAIIGMTKIASISKDDAKRQYCLEKIDSASSHLLRIINDILDMSKIEAHKFDLIEQAFNLEKMITEAVGVVTFLCDEKEQNLVVKLDERLPSRIIADEMRLKQVITNLLSNAIKFTGTSGTIILSVKVPEYTDTTTTLRIEVVDNGIGIEESQIRTLFTAFEQADGSITRKYGGTGLGLAICKKIVELMGGEIWVESQIGVGSKFIFTFTVQNDDVQESDILRPKVSKEDFNILAIDDAAEIRQYFSYVMGSMGMPCDVAEDGPTGLRMVEEKRAQGKNYDVIFVDWKMPGMNGIEVTKRIREIVDNNTIIIMISIFEWDKIEKDARAAGVNKFIPKPLFSSALLNAINENFEDGNAAEMVYDDHVKYDFSRFTVLLVEDIDINQEIVTSILEDTGINFEYAKTGKEAVDLVAQGAGRFDLILMDIHMPVMDGYEATAIIRHMGNPAARNIPIVAMTANVFSEDIERCRVAGMDDHIAKPIERGDLITKLDRFLHGKKETLTMVEPEEKWEAEDMVSFINVSEGAARVLNNKKLYFKLLSDCKIGDMCRTLADAINDGRTEDVVHAAHTAKGVAANLSLTELFNVLTDVETHAKSGSDVRHMVDDMMKTVRLTEEAIARLLKGG